MEIYKTPYTCTWGFIKKLVAIVLNVPRKKLHV